MKKSLDNLNESIEPGLEEAQHNNYITIDNKPIRVLGQFVNEIIEFITKLEQA